MPIFEIVFSRPLPIDLRTRSWASSRSSSSPSRLSRSRPSVDELADRLEHHVGVDRRWRRSRSASRSGEPRAARPTRARGRCADACPRGPGGDGRPRRRAATGSATRSGPIARSERIRMLTASSIAVVGLLAAARERDLQPIRPVGGAPGDVDRPRAEDVVRDVAQRLELAVAQDRVLERHLVRVLGRLLEQVALGAEPGRDRHHDASRGSGRSAGS